MSATAFAIHRARKILVWTTAVVLLLPVALVLAILVLANIAPGRALIESEATSLSGGQVVLHGLSGRFPDALRAAHLELHDWQGTWLSLDDLVLDWSPAALFGRVARIDLLTADHLVLRRLPVAAPQPAGKTPPSSGGLPVRIDLARLAIAKLDLGAAIAGRPATLKIEGSARYASLAEATASIAADRMDAPGRYRLEGAVSPQAIRATLDASENAAGLVQGLAKIPALGALTLHATVTGPRRDEAIDLSLAAASLDATARGKIDLVGDTAALDVAVTAPAMAPRPDLSWDGIELKAHLAGPFAKPLISAHAALRGVHGGGAAVAGLVIDAGGNSGAVDAHAVLTGLVLPPPQPGLFADAPLDLTLHARLDSPDRPVTFALTHRLIRMDGDARGLRDPDGDLTARLHMNIPDLAPFAAIGKLRIEGSTQAVATLARHHDISSVSVDGTANFTGGLAPLPAALGQTGFGATATLDGQNLTVTRAIVDGAKAHLDATGTDLDGKLAIVWHVALRDLAALAPQAFGKLDASGTLDTKPDGLAARADITGDVGAGNVPRGPVHARVQAAGLPANPSGTVQADGKFAGNPIELNAELSKTPDGGMHAILKSADWKSLSARADMKLARGQTVPAGTLTARITRLADLTPLLGQPLAGVLTATVETVQTGGKPDAKIDVQASGLSVGANEVGRLSLTGHVRDPAAAADASLVLTASGVRVGEITGQARLTANGPQSALLLRADSSVVMRGGPASLQASARLDAPARTVTLSNLAANYDTETLRLRAPAKLTFGDTTGVDHVALAFGPPGTGPATLDIAGRIAPDLSLTAALAHVTPDLARPFLPDTRAAGTLSANARLTGTMAAPQGTIQLNASGARLLSGPASSLKPASLLANVTLDGTAARIDAQGKAGPKLSLAARGTVPLHAGGALAIHASGQTDLTLLDPVLGASGRRAAGNLLLDADISGSTAAPQINGTVTLARGEIQDYVNGARLTAITARLVAAGDSVRIDQFDAKAGPGTLSLRGSVGVVAPGAPVDLHFTADHARPLSSDLLTATLDADVTLRGQASQFQAAGKILLRRADINIPNGLPPSVAVLHLRRPGEPPAPARAAPPAEIALDLIVDAPSNIFVRGHGLDSELGGKLTIAGTAASPQIAGGFDLRRGTISVAGTTLNFSKGEVGFDGTSVTNKIDPTLNFIADTNSGGVTATLTVGGYADAPTIKLSSVPDLPQDEVLAHLLFGTSVKDLSAIQIAEIAAALAELSGVTGGGGDPLGAVRKGLGLDRLSVGSGGATGSGATVEAGRYVARGVYIGAKQAVSGGGTAAEVQIDITRRLKAKAQLATGGGSVQGATPDNDPGSSLGLSYQFEY